MKSNKWTKIQILQHTHHSCLTHFFSLPAVVILFFVSHFFFTCSKVKSLVKTEISSSSWFNSVKSSSVPDLYRFHTSIIDTCSHNYYFQFYIHTHRQVNALKCTFFMLGTYINMHLCTYTSHRFKAFLSSSLYFLRSRSSLSLQPRPFSCTGFSVEKDLLSASAKLIQSAGFCGRFETTSKARAMSWLTSQRNPGIMGYQY